MISLYIFSTLLVIATAFCVTLIFDDCKHHFRLLAAIVLYYAEIVVLGRLLSLFGLIGNPLAWLLAELFIFILTASFVFRQIGLSVLMEAFTKAKAKCSPKRVLQEIRATKLPPYLVPAAAVIFFGVVGLLIVSLAASVFIPQTMDDILTAYLPRVGYWIQDGSLIYAPASPYNSVQFSYPINAHIPLLRSIVLSERINFIGLDQWIAAIASAVGIFGLGKLFNAKKGVSLAMAGIWLMIPTIGVQIGVALTDLLTVFFFLSALIFGYLGWTENRPWKLGISTLAFALLLGTKQTALFSLPALIVPVFALLKSPNYRVEVKRLTQWALISAPFLLFVGLDRYLLNWRYYGHPLGDPDSFNLFTGGLSISFGERIRSLIDNVERTLVNIFFADLDFLPYQVTDQISDAFQTREPFITMGRAVSGGVPWLGFMASSVLLIGLTLALVHYIRKPSKLPLLVILPALTHLGVLYYMRPSFSLAFSRYLITAVALLLPVVAFSVSKVKHPKKQMSRVFLGGVSTIVALGLLTQASFALTRSEERPIGLESPGWNESNYESFAHSMGFIDRYEIIKSLRYIDTCLEIENGVGISYGNKYPQGLLFGDNFQREVQQLYGVSVEDKEVFDPATGVSALVVATSEVIEIESDSQLFSRDDAELAVGFFGPVSVVSPKSVRSDQECRVSGSFLVLDAIKAGFFDEVEENSVIVVPESGEFLEFALSWVKTSYFDERNIELVLTTPPNLIPCSSTEGICTQTDQRVYVLNNVDRAEGTSLFFAPVEKDLGYEDNPLISMQKARMFGNASPNCVMESPNAGKIPEIETNNLTHLCSGSSALLLTFLEWFHSGCTRELRGWYICPG